jgi:hypothetical protein
MSTVLEELRKVRPGWVLYYKITEKHTTSIPANPDYVWTGKVLSNMIESEFTLPGFWVQPEDAQQEGEREWVGVDQIISYSSSKI